MRAFVACLLAVASHLMLDLTNIYGVRLLFPFSDAWLRLDITSVVDVWIWCVIAFALAGPCLSGLVGSEIRSADLKSKSHGRGFAIFALIFLLIYNCGRGVLHARAAEALESRLYQGISPLRVEALPDAVNPLRWRGLVDTGEFYAVADINLTREFDPTRADIFRRPQPDPALEAARRAPAIREFLRFAQAPLWRVAPSGEIENGSLVEVFDMRFGGPREPAFVASALLDSNLRVTKSWFQFGRLRPR
jgi:inner membrane protein